MDVWLSLREIAALPGMPNTQRGALKAAERGRWEHRQRAGRGGGREYRLASLPLHAQRAYLTGGDALAGDADPAPAQPRPARDNLPAVVQVRPDPAEEARRRTKAANAARFAALADSDPRRRRAKAREWLILAAGELARAGQLTAGAARDAICTRINTGELAVPAHVETWLPRRHGVRALSPHSLYRWTVAWQEGGPWALTDGYGNRDGQNIIDTEPALLRVLLGQLLATPQATARDLADYAAAKAADLAAAGVRLPSTRTVERWRTRWIDENRALWAYMTAPGQWKNHFQVAFGSHQERIDRLNQVWELDSTPGDWLLTDGRHTVVGCIDLYSRRLALRVSRSSSGLAVGQTFRRAVLDWGVPEIARTDNGKDYVSDYFSGVLRDLEIVQELCLPFASEQKGTIERALKTMAYGLPKLLPGFCGHNVAEAAKIRDRRAFSQRIMQKGEIVEVSMSAADLQAALDNWLANDYMQRPHRGEGMNGLSPIAKAAAWSGAVRTVDARALDALLAPIAGDRIVGKKGIKWDHRWYISPVLAGHVGEPVRCRYDEADLGRLYVYTADAFLCVAEDPAMTGISKAEVAAVAKAKQKKLLAEQAKELKDMKKQVAANAAEEVLKAKAQAAGKLLPFPSPKIAHSTPALVQGAAAAKAAAPKGVGVDTAETIAAKAALAAEMAAANVVTLPEGPADRYRRWLKLDRAIRDGLGVDSPDDITWWEGYATTAEYRGQVKLAADYPQLYGLAEAAD